jgi:hypothetical protein
MAAIDVGDLVSRMTAAGQALAGDVWSRMQTFALPELKKIAIQIEAIALHAAEFGPAGAKALLDMQVKASIGVIVAMTELTLLAVQTAINGILSAVKDAVNGALPFALIP